MIKSFFENSISRKKGQTRVVGEMLLFAIGVIILSYILIMFGSVQENINKVSVQDQMKGVANYVKSSMTKMAFSTDNVEGNMTIELPMKISGKGYVMEIVHYPNNNPVENDFYNLTVFIAQDPKTNVTVELFNIGSKYNIAEVRLTGGAQYYVIGLRNGILTMDYYRFSSNE